VRARRGVLYLADLSRRAGTAPGKVRPVLLRVVLPSRAIDNRRLVRALRPLPKSILAEVVEKLRTLGDL